MVSIELARQIDPERLDGTSMSIGERRPTRASVIVVLGRSSWFVLRYVLDYGLEEGRAEANVGGSGPRGRKPVPRDLTNKLETGRWARHVAEHIDDEHRRPRQPGVVVGSLWRNALGYGLEHVAGGRRSASGCWA